MLEIAWTTKLENYCKTVIPWRTGICEIDPCRRETSNSVTIKKISIHQCILREKQGVISKSNKRFQIFINKLYNWNIYISMTSFSSFKAQILVKFWEFDCLSWSILLLQFTFFKGTLTFEGRKVSHRKLHCQANYFHRCLSLGLQRAHKLLGPDTKSWGSPHEGSKYRHCQEIPKWLSKHQERPADRLKWSNSWLNVWNNLYTWFPLLYMKMVHSNITFT